MSGSKISSQILVMKYILFVICNGMELKNGTLLALLEENGFNCWIVVDKNIPYQQNISKLPCTVIVLDVFRNTLEHITPLFPALLIAIEGIGRNNVIVISEPKNK